MRPPSYLFCRRPRQVAGPAQLEGKHRSGLGSWSIKYQQTGKKTGPSAVYEIQGDFLGFFQQQAEVELEHRALAWD